MKRAQGKTKSRFNKKEGYRFTLLSRSQQDPLYYDDVEGSEQVLHPLDRRTAAALEEGKLLEMGAVNYASEASNNKRFQSQAPKGVKELREVDELGFRIDGYDYSQHLSTCSEGGVFVGVNGQEVSGRLGFDERLIRSNLFASEEELPRRHDLEAILLAPESMDEDMKKQLEIVEEEEDAVDEWGEEADDFMNQLLAPADGGLASFDFEAHMARLMHQVKEEEVDGDFEDDFIPHEPVQGDMDEDEHFAQVLAEYEDDDAEENEHQGAGELSQSDPLFLHALHEYTREEEDDTSLGCIGNPPPGSDTLKFLRPEAEDEIPITDLPPTLENLMQAWGTYSVTAKPEFDCQTILSTRSTTDNLPSMISLPSSKKQSKSKVDVILEEEEEEEEEEMEGMSDQLHTLSLLGDCTKRNKLESKEDKRKRKQQLREEKRERRLDKKSTKQIFKEEKKLVMKVLTARNAPLPGVSEFKI